MPLAGHNNLDELYCLMRLVEEHAERLQRERDDIAQRGGDNANLYVIDVKIRALSEECARLGSSISGILDRDLAR